MFSVLRQDEHGEHALCCPISSHLNTQVVVSPEAQISMLCHQRLIVICCSAVGVVQDGRHPEFKASQQKCCGACRERSPCPRFGASFGCCCHRLSTTSRTQATEQPHNRKSTNQKTNRQPYVYDLPSGEPQPRPPSLLQPLYVLQHKLQLRLHCVPSLPHERPGTCVPNFIRQGCCCCRRLTHTCVDGDLRAVVWCEEGRQLHKCGQVGKVRPARYEQLGHLHVSQL